MLDHPPSRMMTVVAVGAHWLYPGLSTSRQNYPFVAVVILAAHHMIIVIQRRRFPEREN
jgi:hypothetical protein